MFYTKIQIKGKLDPDWSDWFEAMQVQVSQGGDTILCGSLPDKSAVYGMISRLSSLGVTLISVTCQEEIEFEPTD